MLFLQATTPAFCRKNDRGTSEHGEGDSNPGCPEGHHCLEVAVFFTTDPVKLGLR